MLYPLFASDFNFTSQVTAEDGGMYKVRLESDSGEVKWSFVDVRVIEEETS